MNLLTKCISHRCSVYLRKCHSFEMEACLPIRHWHFFEYLNQYANPCMSISIGWQIYANTTGLMDVSIKNETQVHLLSCQWLCCVCMFVFLIYETLTNHRIICHSLPALPKPSRVPLARPPINPFMCMNTSAKKLHLWMDILWQMKHRGKIQ